jgi:hypothetical protein
MKTNKLYKFCEQQSKERTNPINLGNFHVNEMRGKEDIDGRSEDLTM